MEEEGIFYFFEHDQSKHTLVLADDSSAYASCPRLAQAETCAALSSREEFNAILDGSLEFRVTHGEYKSTDYNFTTPSTSLLAAASGQDTSRSMYEYPGGQLTSQAHFKQGLMEGEVTPYDAKGAGAQKLQCKGGRLNGMSVIYVDERPRMKAMYKDGKPMVSVPPFGMCSSPANPTVAAATAAALGVLTPMPGVPVTPAPWVPGAPTVMIANMPALDNNSKLMCTGGGVIQIVSPGGTTVLVP
jgi:Phage tail baseplate hub (GPD)/Domain of unknown function (DUF4280)